MRITPDFMPNSGGSCFIEWGRTRILVTANVAYMVPPFLEGASRGWLTAEYSMLPGSTGVRKPRERQKSDSRSIEIQRLIGRSLRSVVDFTAIPGITITVDADVIEADGGTRIASITGGYIAVAFLAKKLLKENTILRLPFYSYLAAVSAGIVGGIPLLDLCYQEDSRAEADMNFVGTETGSISEIQISGEKRPVSEEELSALLLLCKKGVQELIALQKEILGR
jgi:ribonuclease PH